MQITCKQLICYDKDSVGHRLYYSWLNGTECGEEKWCQSGECVEKTPQSHRLAIQWSECSQLCNGTQSENAYCFNEANQKVSDKLCSRYQLSNQRPCNRDCNVEWVFTIKINCKLYSGVIHSPSWEPKLSPCSAECGKGTQNVSYSCVQRFTKNHSNIVDDSNCRSEMPLPKPQECTGLCESAKWNYTEYGPVRSGIIIRRRFVENIFFQCSCSSSKQFRSTFCTTSNDERIGREHCQHLHTEELERSCIEHNCWNYAKLTIIVISCIASLLVIYELVVKVVAYRKTKDPETSWILKYEAFDEKLEFIDYNSFKPSQTNKQQSWCDAPVM